jgi:archaeosine-15-forming tRNA-guanine transglycosylase
MKTTKEIEIQIKITKELENEAYGRLTEVLEAGYVLYTINQLNDGQLVHGLNGYSRVRKCVHGNKYYAYISEENEDGEDFVEVSDDDEDHISACCG